MTREGIYGAPPPIGHWHQITIAALKFNRATKNPCRQLLSILTPTNSVVIPEIHPQRTKKKHYAICTEKNAQPLLCACRVLSPVDEQKHVEVGRERMSRLQNFPQIFLSRSALETAAETSAPARSARGPASVIRVRTAQGNAALAPSTVSLHGQCL